MTYFLNINKESDMTAHDVVAIVRRITGIKQVGHAGTLDPAATGVLPVAVGKACRLLRYLSSDKTYIAEILLGVATTTDDLEGEVLEKKDFQLSKENVMEALQSFTGPLEQRPPNFSAVHHEGKRLYDLARKGITVENIPLRKVVVHKLEILDMPLPVVKVRIACSAGTYIRSIARDLGDKLSVGGSLKSLIREVAGPFTLDRSITLGELKDIFAEKRMNEVMIDPGSVLDLKSISINEELAKKLSFGQAISMEMLSNAGIHDITKASWHEPQSVILRYDGHSEDSLIAVCRLVTGAEPSDTLLKPEVVIVGAA